MNSFLPFVLARYVSPIQSELQASPPDWIAHAQGEKTIPAQQGHTHETRQAESCGKTSAERKILCHGITSLKERMRDEEM